MPMYMDIHEVQGATAEDVAKAHIADVKTQGKYGVEYHKYWLNESTGKIFCLCSAPNPEAVEPFGFLTCTVAVALVSGDGHVGREIDVDGNGGHGIPWQGSGSAMPCPRAASPPTR